MSALTTMRPHSPAGAGNRPILLAALSVAVAGILVKGVAASKEIVVAGVYGRSDAMDAFLAAALIPGLLVNLIAESMNQALIPTLIRVREQEGHEPARDLLAGSILSVTALLTVVSILMACTARWFFPLIASNFPPAKLELSIRIFYALLPTVLLMGLASNFTAVLNTVNRFAAPAMAPVVIPLVTIAAALALGSRLGIWALVYATLAGSVVHVALVGSMMKFGVHSLRVFSRGFTEPAREVARQYGPVFLSGVMASGGLLVDQSMAAALPAGSVSALVYGNRIVSVAMSLMAGALSTALTPYFSSMMARNDWVGCRRTVRTWVRYSGLASVPLTLVLLFAAHPIVRIAFQHRAFGPADTRVVASVLAMSAIQLPFFVASRVYYRFLIAIRRTELAFYCGALNLAIDIVLNVILMRWLGVAGIALATSLWTVSTFLFLAFWTRKLLRRAIPNQPAGGEL